MKPRVEVQQERNQLQLSAELSRIYACLTALGHVGPQNRVESPASGTDHQPTAQVPPASLDRICSLFGLTPFEGDLLLLCAGVELESRFGDACAAAHKDPRARWATFSLALAALPDAHWSAVSHDRPLRYWNLLELSPGENLLSSPLRIDERIVQFLANVPCGDARLATYIHPAPATASSPSVAQAECADRAAHYWARSTKDAAGLKPILLVSRRGFDQMLVAQETCRQLELQLSTIAAYDVPASAADRARFTRLWTREALLTRSALYVRTGDDDNADVCRSLAALLDQLTVPVFIEVREGSCLERLEGLRLHVPSLQQQESKVTWIESLGPLAERVNGGLDRVVEQFNLDAGSIRFASALTRNATEAENGPDVASTLWHICRTHSRRSLEGLARRIEPKAHWNDLLLPPLQTETLHHIATHVRQRSTVHTRWGFADRYSRGLGVTALFAGPSGTGKTMASEVLAGDLELDLYHVDLASVVSKYIGETEKNLRRIFDAAEESGAVLLFDEADALFGKRSEIRDSHDRYANLEISYLLQRMESYTGLAILTTNMKQALDNAFLRRIRFILQFPFPDAAQRQRIWERVFPEQTPLRNLDFARLAQLNVAGGTIRNIAMLAAFLAAEDSTAVDMDHLLRATKVEYAKLERPLTATETGGWA